MIKKFFNCLFSLLLVVALIPTAALAEVAEESSVGTETVTESPEESPSSDNKTSEVSTSNTESSSSSTERPVENSSFEHTNDVSAQKTLEQAVDTLTSSFYKPKLNFGTDTNINDVVAQELRRIGAGDVSVRVVDVKMSATAAYAHTGISSDSANNGSIEYFWMDSSGFDNSLSTLVLRQAQVTFELSKDGKTAQYTCNVLIPWDTTKTSTLLQNVSQNLAPQFEGQQETSGVISDFTLPYKLSSEDGSTLSWSKVTWTSSDTSVVRIDGYGTENYKAVVTRGVADKQVTLTATVSLSSSDAPDATYQRSFTITVPGDPAAVTEAQNSLSRRIGRRFRASNIKDVSTNRSADLKAVSNDLQMPRPKDFGLDGKRYQFTYSASNSSISFNGYRGTVYQPLPESNSQQVDITLTVTDKENPEVSASKTITATISPLNQAAIDSEVQLMNDVKSHFWEALSTPSNQQDKQQSVSASLSTPLRYYRAQDGSVAWSYDASDTTSAESGIVPTQLPSYDSMGSATQARTYSSSMPNLIQNENLVLAQTPEYDTSVTVSALLSSARYARYASLYPDNKQFQALANQPVSATFTVSGEKGAQPSGTTSNNEKQNLVSVTLSVVGRNINGQAQHWAPTQTIEVPKGTTADQVTYQYLKAQGLTYDTQGGYLSSITSPALNMTLATAENNGSYTWWQFFVNGTLSDKMANNVSLDSNTTITWVYAGQESLNPAPENTLVINPFAQHPHVDSSWSGFNGVNSLATTQTTPVDTATLRWSITEGTCKVPGFISDQVIVGNTLYYVSGSVLKAVDKTTGKIIKTAQIGSSVSYFARPIYINGLIVVATDDGCLTAFSAETMECVWKSSKLKNVGSLQSVSSMSVSKDTILAEFTQMSGFSAAGGYMVAVDAATGSIKWMQEAKPSQSTNPNVFPDVQSAGYYWAGATASGSDFIIGDEASTVKLINGATGATTAKLNLGSPIRSGIVPVSVDENGDGTYLAVTRNDGVLHLIKREGLSLVQLKQVKFASESTSTPTVSGSNVFVNGVDTDGYGTISVISLDTFSIVDQARAGKGKAQSTPLVSVQKSGTYAYFTTNGLPGGVWMYTLGTGKATQIFSPDAHHQNYTTSSVIADSEGNLYYTNDSGTLFSLMRSTDSGEGKNPKSDNFNENIKNLEHDSQSSAVAETGTATSVHASERITQASLGLATSDPVSSSGVVSVQDASFDGALSTVPTTHSDKQTFESKQALIIPTIPLLSVVGFFASVAVLIVFVVLLKNENAATHHVSHTGN